MSSEIDDKSFVRTFAIVLGVLVSLAVVFAFTANAVTGNKDTVAAGDAIAKQAIADRLAPIATLAIASESAKDDAVTTPVATKSGADVVASACAACHASGVLNAPKIGDTAAWQARLDMGMDTLLSSAINGKGAMPARGGNPALSDDEVKAAIINMLKESGVDADSASSAQAAAVTDGAVAAETVADSPAPAAGPDLTQGEAVYKVSCNACHGAGVAGSPKLGDVNAWAARIEQGLDALTQHALNGYQGASGYMPAKGGNPSIADDDVAAAVAYMVNQSQ